MQFFPDKTRHSFYANHEFSGEIRPHRSACKSHSAFSLVFHNVLDELLTGKKIQMGPIEFGESMSWQQRFLETFGTGGLGGMSMGTWLRCVADNQFSIDPPYWLRAGVTTLSCLQNSLYRRIEDRRYGEQLSQTEIKPPLFILGLWRSGTTHLHNLLAQDERFAFPNTYQVFYPHTFLSTEAWNARTLDMLLPSRRVQDNVKLGADQPQEDDFAICGMTGMSFMMSLAFPRRAAEYSRYITMTDTTMHERASWRNAMQLFLRKLTLKYNKPLVLKSPSHTAHVRELAEMFPDAKFVLIHRDPYEVYSSTMHCFEKVFNMWALQRKGDYDISGSTIRNYRDVTEKYFAERHLIPKSNLIEVAYRDLESTPLDTLERIYQQLDLPSFEHAQPNMRRYLDSLGNYRKNRHREIASDVQYRLAHEWRDYFSNWGYADGTDHDLDRAA